jgi:hypothetical protein
MEYALGPVLALLLAMKFTDWKTKKTEQRVESVEAKLELVQKQIPASEATTLQKTMVTFQPVVKAVRQLQEEIGIS